MDKEKVMEFDELVKMKEKRRISREKGKKVSRDYKFEKKKQKHRNVKHIEYFTDMDYDDYYYE